MQRMRKKPITTRRHRDRQTGLALILVLWLLALLTLIASAYAASTRTEIQLTSDLLRQAEARALAEAGIWRTVAVLSSPMAQQPEATNGTPHYYEFAGHKIQIRVQDEAGKIDLNAGRAELFDGLFQALGVADARRQTLVDSILDWRDRDNLRRTHGHEDDDYHAMGYLHGAKNGPFNSVDELLRVIGMDRALLTQAAPALTVYSQQPAINPDVAPALVLAALPGTTPEQADDYLQQRQQDHASRSNGLDQTHPRFISRTRGQVFTITSTATLQQTRVTQSAVISLQAGRQKPYAVLAWNTVAQ